MEAELSMFEAIMADGGLVVILRFPVGIGDAPANDGEFDAFTGEVGVKLPQRVYACVIEAFGLKINIGRQTCLS